MIQISENGEFRNFYQETLEILRSIFGFIKSLLDNFFVALDPSCRVGLWIISDANQRSLLIDNILG